MKNYFATKNSNEAQTFVNFKNVKQNNCFGNVFKMLSILLFVILFSPTKNFAQQPGDNDPSFNNNNPATIGYNSGFNNVGNNAIIQCSALQNDGKIILAGSFQTYNSLSGKTLIRLNTDGSRDQGFLNGFLGQITPDEINTISIQNDNKIIIGGSFTSYSNGLVSSNLIRLYSSGYNDYTFNNGGLGFNGIVRATAIQVDGKIIVAGDFSTYNGSNVNGIARLDTNGILDPTFLIGTGISSGGFPGGAFALAIQPNGKVICAGLMDNYNGTIINKIARLNTDGTLDFTFGPAFGPDNDVYALALQPDGKILIGGIFSTYDGINSYAIARLDSNGILDATFLVGTGASPVLVASINSILLQPDNKILIGGYFTGYNGTPAGKVARLNSNGTFDGTFNTGTGFADYCATLALQPNGKIIVGGTYTSYNGTNVNRIQRLNDDGSIDFTFNNAVGAENPIAKSIVLPNDKIIIGGNTTAYNNSGFFFQHYLARLNPDGDIDFNFSPIFLNDQVYNMAVQADGKLLVFGYFTTYNGVPCPNLIRLNVNGSLDAGFTAQNIPGQVTAITLQPDNKIIIGGNFGSYAGFSRNGIARLNTDGTLDATFNPGTGIVGFVQSCDVQPNGKILIAGSINQYDGTNVNNIVRVNSNGTIDVNFNIVANNTWFISSVKQHLGNKILIAGSGTFLAGASAIIRRLNDDGSVDNTFTTQTFLPPLGGDQQFINNIYIQPNGKILAGGRFEYTTVGNIIHHNLIRLNRDGVIDSTFNVGEGANEFVGATGIQNDRKIIITGNFNTYNVASRKYIARILNPIVDAATPVVTASANPVCKGSATVLSVNGNLNDATDWYWYTGSCGGTLIGNGATLSVSPSANETYYVRGEGGGSNPGLCGTISITVNTLSSTPAQVFSTLPFGDVCAGTSLGLNTVGGTLGTSANYFWFEGGCGLGASFATGQNINFTPTGVGAKTYYVRAEGLCNTTNCAQITIFIRTAPPSSAVVVPPINNLPQYACNGTVINNINVPFVAGASYYTWDGPNGTSFNGVANTYSSMFPFANITFGNPSGSGYYIGVQAGNACGTTTRKVQWVRNQVSVPATIFGITEVCPGNNYSYTIVGVTGATSYTYTAPAGVLIDGNPSPFTTNLTIVALTIPAGFVSGSFCVTANTPCFTSAQKCITISSQATIPSAITGVTSVCPLTTQTYSVAPHVGAIFNWILPPNSSGVSNSNSINVTFNNNFNGGDIRVSYTNLCLAVSPLRSKTISVGIPATPPSISCPATGLCNQTVVYTCPAQAGVTYNWTVPTTTTINGGNGTNAISATHGLFGTGTVCVTANNTCGSSQQRCITVKGAPNSPAAITPLPLAWCAPAMGISFQADVSLLTGSYSLQWAWVPAAAANYVLGQSSSNLVLDWNNSGAATILVTAQNACGNATRSLSVNIPNCARVAHGENISENINTENGFTIFPNPSSGIVNIEFENTKSENCSIQMRDARGKCLIASTVNSTTGFNHQIIDASHMAKGVYMLEIKTSSYIKTSRIVLQ